MIHKDPIHQNIKAAENGYTCPPAVHGGDVYRNEVKLDYSVSLNPLGVPEKIRSAALKGLDEITHYPDPYHIELRTALAKAEKTDPEKIVCGSGASELIMAAVHAFMPHKALITAPCYSGYETALRASEAAITEYPLSESDDFELGEGILDMISEDTDIVFITDPNNPTGRLTDEELIVRIAEKCAACGAVLMIDECFRPLTGRGSSGLPHGKGSSDAAFGTVLHLRAFTKTFAIPGIRLGYIITDDISAVDKIRKHLPEWNISRIAERAGAAASELMTDSDYISRAAAEIARERVYLTGELESLGIRVYPGDANYLLIRTESGLYEKLLANGILIRRCANFHGLDETYYRIAVRRHEDNVILTDVLRRIMQE